MCISLCTTVVHNTEQNIANYPYIPICKVWIYRLLFAFRLFARISLARIKLAVSWAGNLPFLGTLLSQRPKIDRIDTRRGTPGPV